MAAGTKLGIRLMTPRRMLLKTSSSSSRETMAMAMKVPSSMPSMFLWVDWAPTTETPGGAGFHAGSVPAEPCLGALVERELLRRWKGCAARPSCAWTTARHR